MTGAAGIGQARRDGGRSCRQKHARAVVGKDGALKLVAAWLATGKMSDVIPRSPARAINGGNG